jgi:MFS transporter, SP family, sugar:H+ symporter
MATIKNDLTKTTLWENRKSIFICSLIATASFQYGLDFSLIGGFQAMVGFLEVFGVKDPSVPAGWNLTVLVQQLISSLMTLGAFVGSLCAGPISSYLNRRWSIFIGSVLCCIAVIVMITTTHIGALYFGRLLLGFAKYII